MVKSMTGYAKAEKSCAEDSVSIEIRAVNSRYRDIFLRMPAGYQALEEKVKNRIEQHIGRGRIEISVQICEAAAGTCNFEVNRPLAAAYHAALKELQEAFTVPGPVSLDHLLAAGGIIRPVEREKNAAAVWDLLAPCVDEALDALDRMRRREGAFLADDMAHRLVLIGVHLDAIAEAAADLAAAGQERLKTRIAALTEGVVELDPGRIAQEAAILADKSDISEEVVRARCHLKEFDRVMGADDAAGRLLNFLTQEMHREFNTMGSKSADTEISHRIVAVKAELEKIREQVQNVE